MSGPCLARGSAAIGADERHHLLSSEPALRAALAVSVILVAGSLGVCADEGYIYAAMAISAMNAAPSIRSCEGRETKRGISPAVTNGEIA